MNVIVIGAGPAGVVAALRAADLGAKTALIIRDEFGGMAASDGPVPVRTVTASASASPCSIILACSRA
jgi:pyruvate/2-oxoglutarate dehydrogenase complex dihydrolipoamide dehydrogenase (E3) component